MEAAWHSPAPPARPGAAPTSGWARPLLPRSAAWDGVTHPPPPGPQQGLKGHFPGRRYIPFFKLFLAYLFPFLLNYLSVANS